MLGDSIEEVKPLGEWLSETLDNAPEINATAAKRIADIIYGADDK